IVVRGQPVERGQRQLEPENLAHQLGRLLGAPVGADQNVRERLTAQALGALAHLLAPMLGERPLGIAARTRLSLAVAQQPELHSLGSSSRTGCGAGGMLCGSLSSGARGVGQSAKGQGFSSLLKVPKRPICCRYWLRLSPKPCRLPLGAP